MAMAFRVARGVVGSAFLAGGTFAAACYYTIWDAENKVLGIEGDLVNLNKALVAADADIDEHKNTLQAVEKQKESAEKRVADVKTNLAKAESQVKRLKDDLKTYKKKLEEEKKKVVAHHRQTTFLQRLRSERAENVTVAQQALLAAQKQALQTKTEFDPIKRLQIDKWLN
eukprot:CAMPEP_0197488522 /NCGR_PEP_ID=MMETSP1311-20131121/3454_1 /TAXON_ID=464262 /ORGANISM="Genus nov. species nov., Strain RCC856" /LENGTH=169 /DNA_ID=CAMNT_0043032579 /DNA_START=119 /DNA_END=628 /DNA_ORIENTATION=+